MNIDLLATQGRTKTFGGLASVDTAKLRQMRDMSLRACFARMDESRWRMEFVARIHGKEFINDAAARSVNATLYTFDRMAGGIIWIALGGDNAADYSSLRHLAMRKVRMLICVGDDNRNLCNTFNNVISTIEEVPSLSDAVMLACYNSMTGSKVVFSPATRIGMSDEEAGRMFSREVNEL